MNNLTRKWGEKTCTLWLWMCDRKAKETVCTHKQKPVTSQDASERSSSNTGGILSAPEFSYANHGLVTVCDADLPILGLFFSNPPNSTEPQPPLSFFFFSPIFVIHSPEKAKEESVCLHLAKCSYSAPRALPGARPSSNTRRSGSQMDRTRKTTQGVTELEWITSMNQKHISR